MDDKKKYNYLENVLQTINRNYISLPKNEVRRNKWVLENVLDQLITKMQEKDYLFRCLYSRVFYGGSFYDGVRVGKPEEFDLDLLMALPKFAKPTLTNSNIPGFVHLQLKDYAKWEKQPEARQLTNLANLLDRNHYLITTKVSTWIEGIIRKALNDFPQSDRRAVFNTPSGRFRVKIHKGGPAHTLKLSGTIGKKKVVMDVDFVPCFVFGEDKWPPTPYRSNPIPEKPEFFIVPKIPRGNRKFRRYWRLSFQEQERILIYNRRYLKPTLKLIKKLRDNLDHKIVASYFIKTVFLWEVEKDAELWNNSLSYVFMTMLNKYKQFFEQGTILYFWNRRNKLLGRDDNAEAVQNIANKLKNIINDIERHPNNPHVLEKYFGGPLNKRRRRRRRRIRPTLRHNPQ